MRKNFKYGSLKAYTNVVGLTCPVDLAEVFKRQAPVDVEIGFGTGEYIQSLSQGDPNRNFLGLEQCAERLVKTLRKLHDQGLNNVQLVKIDAQWAFQYVIKPGSISNIHCLFPCPWPKKKHIKYRLFSHEFLCLLNTRLVSGGTVKLVTDHHPFADWVMEGVEGTGFSVMRRSIPPGFGTKFEKKWVATGQDDFDEMIFIKQADVQGPAVEGTGMQAYFLEDIDPSKVVFPEYTQDGVAVKFKDLMFDEKREKGMVQAVVGEDNSCQYLWILFVRQNNGWCLRAAPGNCVLPTDGVRRALEMAHSAFGESARS